MNVYGKRGVLTGALAVALGWGLVPQAQAVTAEYNFEAQRASTSAFANFELFFDVGDTSFDLFPSVSTNSQVQDFVSSNATITGQFSYDTDATSINPTNPNFQIFTNVGGSLTATFIDPATNTVFTQSASSPNITLQAADTIRSDHSFDISNDFAFDAPRFAINTTPTEHIIDLNDQGDSSANFEELGLDTFIVRITEPDQVPIEFFGVDLEDSSKTVLPTYQLPSSLDLADFDETRAWLQFRAENVQVTVLEEDYDTFEQFEIASNYIADNLRTTEYFVGANSDWTIVSLEGGVDTGLTPIDPILPGSVLEPGGPGEPPVFVFEDVDVDDENVWFFDPVVAVGYDYEVLDGPLVTGIQVEEVGGQTEFLFSSDQLNSGEVFTLFAGVLFDFSSLAPSGISEFTVFGIDPDIGLDPNDPLAFVTGLTFADSGQVDLTMTPITQDTDDNNPPTGNAIPEPLSAGLTLLALGTLAVSATRRRRA